MHPDDTLISAVSLSSTHLARAMITWKHIAELSWQIKGTEGAHEIADVKAGVLHSCETYALVG